MTTKEVNRVRKLNSIAKKIAVFMMEETWTDEKKLQGKLDAALGCLNDAINILDYHMEKESKERCEAIREDMKRLGGEKS